MEQHTEYILAHRRVECPAWRDSAGCVVALYNYGCIVQWEDKSFEFVRYAGAVVGFDLALDFFTGSPSRVLHLPKASFYPAGKPPIT